VTVIFGEEEVEIGSRVSNYASFTLFVDEVAIAYI